MFKFFDGHCDTVTTAMKTGEEMRKNTLHIDLEGLHGFEKAIQIFAVWIDKNEEKNIFDSAVNAVRFFKEQCEKNNDITEILYTGNDLRKTMINNKVGGILSIEGCEILEGKIENIKKLYDMGIRIMTLSWNYENELGYGAATGEKKGLKQFGRECMDEMNRYGIIADVSHINERGFWDILERSDKVIASHSNSKRICSHFRNLSDEQIKALGEKNGIIGINLYPLFLSGGEKADITDIKRHISHIASIIGEDNIGFGCDFDGIGAAPEGIRNVSDMIKIRCEIEKDFGRDFCDKLFFWNFYGFMSKKLT